MSKNHILGKEKFIIKMSQSTPLLAAIFTEKSFSRAAEKLGVHQSAISHRVNLLEESLNFPLFERTTRQVIPTEYGRILCKAAIDSTNRWEEAYAALDHYEGGEVTRLSVSSSLAMKWVLPNLSGIESYDLDLSLDVNDTAVNFETSQVDAAIRFGRGPYPGLYSVLLKKSQLIAVVSPNYCDTDIELGELIQSPETVILEDRTGEGDDTGFSWVYYRDKIKLPAQSDCRCLAFDRADLVLQAAVNGMGVGLGRTLLIEQDIEQGFLRPVGPAIDMDAAYWLVCKPDFAKTQRFDMLRSWLMEKVNLT